MLSKCPMCRGPIKVREVIDLTTEDMEDTTPFSCDNLFPPPINPVTNEYRVERILEHKVEGNERWFKVKWFGFPLSDATFEPEGNLEGCRDLLNEYLSNTVYFEDMPALEPIGQY